MTTPQIRNAAVRERMLQFAESIPPEDLTPTLAPDAAELINENAFAFSLAVVLDRGTRAEIIWTIPYWIRLELGHLDPARIGQMTRDEVLDMLSRIPRKPRYMRDAPQTILELAHLVSDEFGGDAELIWRGQTAHAVKRQFRSIHGVGDGIASMAVILLERCRGVRFPDWSVMDVKPDVHVQRVLYRLGVAPAMGGGGRRSGSQSLVTMMESANLWKGDDLACFGVLDRPVDRTVLTQGQVSARAVVVVEVRCENAP